MLKNSDFLGSKIVEQAANTGFVLTLSDDWQRIRCAGPDAPPTSLKNELMSHRAEVLFWLKAMAVEANFSGRIVGWDKKQLEDPPAPHFDPESMPQKQKRWMASAGAILAQRDDKGRLDATYSEISSCIDGIRTFPDPESREMLNQLKAAIPESKKCSSRLKAQAKREFERKSREKELSHANP